EKWFGPIKSTGKYVRKLPQEPEQREERRELVHADVPLNSLYIAFHGPGRQEDDYYAMDLLSDLLSRGTSSRLYRRLVKEGELFSEINAYHTGSIDANLFVVEGKPLPHVSLEAAEEAIWKELN